MEEQRIIVVGSGGRLGAAVARYFASRGHAVTRLDRRSLDLTNTAAVRSVLGALEFDLVFNSAALTQVDECESDVAGAFAVNADAPGTIAEICRGRGARFVHVGTDYVYDGVAEGFRSEGDAPNPLSAYGKSKLAGDLRVLEADPGFLVVRTSWVFGPDRPSFVDAMLARALEGPEVEAIADKESTPCYSRDFASLLETLLDVPGAGGLFNLCNTGACSWREFAAEALAAAHALGAPLRTTDVGAIQLADMTQFVAPRPKFTAMSTVKYRDATGRTPRPWQEAVHAYIRDDWGPNHVPDQP